MDLAKCSWKMDCAEWTGSSNVAGFLTNCGNCGWEIQFWVEITFLGSRKVFVEVFWWRYCNAVFGLVLKVKVWVRSFLLCSYIASNRSEMQLLHGSCQVTYMIYIHHWNEVQCIVMAPCHSCSWWRWRWSDTLWVTLRRIWLHSLSYYLESAVFEIFLQIYSHRYAIYSWL